ncbi:uncharacterized protein LOC116299068 [Actinia tenebrosa]|uniref:Uncharacterized protein LOC116299068 n=1 Tax=Actinia tenebrosa TaxID=6105 RepID=A0A6P8I6G8_ACTTE|nr:uncharacterized protein LOC116299068 [Actinia tenebrosa]
MEALFKNGSFPELKAVKIAENADEILGNDAGKVRTKFLATFDAVPPQGSKEPEMYFRLNNFQKGSKYEYYAVPSSIKVEENVQGVDFGNWTLKGEIPESCCGESVYQTRTCNGSGADSCDGLHLNRTFPCHLKYPITCSGKERKFSFNITLGNVWKDGYEDLSSMESKELVRKLTMGEGSLLEEVENIFKNSSTGYKKMDSNSFKMSQDNGKVRVSFTVLFSEPPSNPDDPEAVFRFKTDDGKIGNFEIDTKSIQIEESVPGFTFEPWTNKNQDDCNKCCGGQLQQTRTCQSKMGRCPDAQLTRSIRCNHVCEEVKCADSSKTVPYVLGILICIFASSFAWL